MRRPKSTMRSKIEENFRKAVKSDIRQIIKNSPLLTGKKKPESGYHRRGVSGESPLHGRRVMKVAVVKEQSEVKQRPIVKLTAKDKKTISQILAIGRNCAVDLSKVHMKRESKPH